MTFSEIVKNGCAEWQLPITDEAVTRILRAKAKFSLATEAADPDFAAHAQVNKAVCHKAITRLAGGTVGGKVLYASAPIKELAFGLTHADPRKLTFGQMANMYTGEAYTTLDKLAKIRQGATSGNKAEEKDAHRKCICLLVR